MVRSALPSGKIGHAKKLRLLWFISEYCSGGQYFKVDPDEH
jgi:hypothetical protein